MHVHFNFFNSLWYLSFGNKNSNDRYWFIALCCSRPCKSTKRSLCVPKIGIYRINKSPLKSYHKFYDNTCQYSSSSHQVKSKMFIATQHTNSSFIIYPGFCLYTTNCCTGPHLFDYLVNYELCSAHWHEEQINSSWYDKQRNCVYLPMRQYFAYRYDVSWSGNLVWWIGICTYFTRVYAISKGVTTLQSVDQNQRETSVYYNCHNIINITCIYRKKQKKTGKNIWLILAMKPVIF